MKTRIFFSLLAAVAVSATLTGCDENSWNDKLNGFEDQNNKDLEQVEAIEYTLSAADYKTIAGLSANKALAGDALKNALAAVGSTGAFSDQITAQEYAPAFLADKYFQLNNGSSVRLTYRTNKGLPAELADAAAAQSYTISKDDYIDVWESDDNFIEAFAPSHPASRYIPRILSESFTAKDGEYYVVTYNEATQEPVFGNVGGGDENKWAPTSVLSGIALNQTVDIKGVVTAICGQGYILTDNSGSVLVYFGSGFDPASVKVGSQVNVSGTVGSYNKGFQIVANKTDVPFTQEIVGEQAVTYPTPVKVSGAAMKEAVTRSNDALAQYVEFTAKVSVSGNFYNLIVDGADPAQGSLYQGTAAQKGAFVNGETVTVRGYFLSISAGKFYNIIPTVVNGKEIKAPARRGSRAKAPAVTVSTTTVNALYRFSNGAWTVASGFVTLSPADYRALGQNYNNIPVAECRAFMPKFLANKFPYAKADAVENVVYNVYNSSDKTYAYHCDQYTFNGGEWVLNDGMVTETNQFIRVNGKWIYDPTVYITLPSGRNQTFSSTYYQACVDWVYENICVPLGDTSIKSGLFYVTKYGNNEYYCGTSAYQNNVDLRPGSAREQYPAGWEGMTDEQIVRTMKDRFMNEVMPAALAKLHPDAMPMEGLDQIYQITFGVYTGENATYVARFKVVSKGKFEPVSCTWDD